MIESAIVWLIIVFGACWLFGVFKVFRGLTRGERDSEEPESQSPFRK